MCPVRGTEGVCSADAGVSVPGHSATGKKCKWGDDAGREGGREGGMIEVLVLVHFEIVIM